MMKIKIYFIINKYKNFNSEEKIVKKYKKME